MSRIGLPSTSAIGLFNTWRAGLTPRLPGAGVARVLRHVQARCCAVFLAGNTLILRDYFLRTRRGGRRELKNPDL